MHATTSSNDRVISTRGASVALTLSTQVSHAATRAISAPQWPAGQFYPRNKGGCARWMHVACGSLGPTLIDHEIREGDNLLRFRQTCCVGDTVVCRAGVVVDVVDVVVVASQVRFVYGF